MAKELGVKFYRTSVKDNINVDEVFKQIAETYLSSLVITKADIVYHDKMSDCKFVTSTLSQSIYRT